ncbi:hypothetical protein PROFUN_14891 [Planoprotostelium fungivorum]|uniref:PARP catalytic domain-containing protein n=1 Tax=Planoprotostelium fungivorum TaxID=1890364 RepID=A0A2P6MY76_9EUKA|nr:hypothetical protein PROFUN_14891 [Planoprotostelium fungivorum]
MLLYHVHCIITAKTRSILFTEMIYRHHLSTERKSHHYNGGTEYSYEGHRAMLMAQLVKGRAARVEHGDSALEGAPPGYHCVLGVSGTTLNEEDYITYRDYSALPSYLFIYKHTS